MRSLAAVVYLSVLVLQDSIHKFVVASTNHIHYAALIARSSMIGHAMNATQSAVATVVKQAVPMWAPSDYETFYISPEVRT